MHQYTNFGVISKCGNCSTNRLDTPFVLSVNFRDTGNLTYTFLIVLTVLTLSTPTRDRRVIPSPKPICNRSTIAFLGVYVYIPPVLTMMVRHFYFNLKSGAILKSQQSRPTTTTTIIKSHHPEH